MRVYSALVSQPRSVRLRNDEGVPIDGQEENERDPGAFLPTVNQYSMIMISPVTWEVVDRVDFQEYEQGLSLECVVLESKQTSTGKKHFMAVGTGYLRGEDTAMRGSVSTDFQLEGNQKVCAYKESDRFIFSISSRSYLNQITRKPTIDTSIFTLKTSRGL